MESWSPGTRSERTTRAGTLGPIFWDRQRNSIVHRVTWIRTSPNGVIEVADAVYEVGSW